MGHSGQMIANIHNLMKAKCQAQNSLSSKIPKKHMYLHVFFIFFADDHSFSLSCRCGGKYSVSKDEAEEVTLISCDTCSLIIELLHYH